MTAVDTSVVVALTAAEHDHVLLTRDDRATRTYEALGVRFRVLGG